jgi:Anti-sigma-K factor rskA
MQNKPPVSNTPDRDNALSSSVPSQSRPHKSNSARIAFIAAMVLLVIVIGTIGTIALMRKNAPSQSTQINTATLASNANGEASFSDSQNNSGHSDEVTISLNGLATPPSAFHYHAWIIDTHTTQALSLGTLALNKDGTYSVKFIESGTNLLSMGDEVEITLEKGTVQLPTGKAMLSATFPPQAFKYIKHLLVSFPNTPGNTGLLVGLVDQAQKLNAASKLLQISATHQNTIAMQCAAQSLIDISEGAHGSHYKPLASQCSSLNIVEAGDGYGLLGANGYIATSESQVSLVAAQSDATDSIHAHSRHVAISLQNMMGWISTIDKDALTLLNNPTDAAKVQEIVAIANHVINNFAASGSGSVDPIPGEGGAIAAYYHTQLMAVLILAPAS